MAKEIFIHRIPAEEVLYAVVIRKSDKQFRNDTPAFESFDSANWLTYVIALAELEADSGFWFADLAAPAQGSYLIYIFKQGGEDPAVGDEKVDQFGMVSDGFAWVDDFETFYNATEADTRTNIIIMALFGGVTVGGFAEGVTVPVDPPTIDTAAIAEEVFSSANGVETGVSLRKLGRRLNAILSGKRNGAGTDTEKFRNAADTVDVVTAVLDSSGNRLSVTINDTY